MKNKIISLAIEQLGNDYTTYCKDMGYNYRIEWCACFISWLAEKLGITDIIPVDMSCNSQISKFKNMGVWHTDRNFQSGDIIYYDWDRLGDSRPADHVGIVEKVAGNTLTVIEGNNGNYPNDRVRR
ncbi:MAG: CHAP domain-containing protein, partial [Ruminococcus sp.]